MNAGRIFVGSLLPARILAAPLGNIAASIGAYWETSKNEKRRGARGKPRAKNDDNNNNNNNYIQYSHLSLMSSSSSSLLSSF